MRAALQFFLTYLLLILTFTLAIILVHTIPSESLTENVEESLVTLEEEGVYPELLNFKLYQLDNYTDALMMNLAVSADSDHPVDAAMLNYWYGTLDAHQMIRETEAAVEHDTEGLTKTSYARYWQGYQVIVRPLLVLFNYDQIRILNYILLFSLATFTAWTIRKKLGMQTMWLFLLSLLLINFPIVPLSMQFSTVFYLAFIAMLVIMRNYAELEAKDLIPLAFFIIGACTSYFDFLTAPLITLGLPLIILVLLRKSQEYRTIIINGAAWGVGYGLCWASKWYIGRLFTGQDILGIAMDSASLHTSNLWRGRAMTLENIFSFIVETMSSRHVLIPAVIILILFLGAFIYFIKSKKALVSNLHFILIAAMVPVWYLILRHHSIQHGWFTWRAMLVTIFAGLILLSRTIDFHKFSKKNNLP